MEFFERIVTIENGVLTKKYKTFDIACTADSGYSLFCSIFYDIIDSREYDEIIRIFKGLRDDIRQFKEDPRSKEYEWFLAHWVGFNTKNSDYKVLEWTGQSWGAEYSPHEVTIYFLYDETHRASYPSTLFDSVLEQAIAFCESSTDDVNDLRSIPIRLNHVTSEPTN